MSRMLIRNAGLATGLLGLVACSPFPADPGVTLTLNNPTEGASDLPFTFNAEVTIDGTFSLVESGCDPSLVHGDPDAIALVPDWDPYACTDGDGLAPAGEGNIQFFVDGIFHAYATTTTIPVDLTPAIAFAYYEEVDLDGDPATTEDVGNAFVCNLYFPDDNLGYASTLFDDAFSHYTSEALGGLPVYEEDENGDYVVMDPQPASYEIFNFIIPPPWTYFNYVGTIDSVNYDDYTGQHIFYAELHQNNHEAVYGVNRDRVFTAAGAAGFDLSGMPADWCGSGVIF
jgi:hypothetical protein